MQRGKKKFANWQQFDEWIDQTAAGRFSRGKAFAGGNWAALYDAVQAAIDTASEAKGEDELQRDDLVPMPLWAAEAFAEVLAKFLASVPNHAHAIQTPGARGPGRWALKYRADLIDWKRFREIWYRHIGRSEEHPPSPTPREARILQRQHRAAAAAKGSRYVVDVFTPFDWGTLNEAKARALDDDWSVFDAASEIFRGSAYQGTAKQMRKSYERVTAALRRGESWRYYQSDWLLFEGHHLSSEAGRSRP